VNYKKVCVTALLRTQKRIENKLSALENFTMLSKRQCLCRKSETDDHAITTAGLKMVKHLLRKDFVWQQLAGF
jgi:hypothetical protein